ncbi:MAG TPA: hypothetical protein VF072_11620 [Thermoleophilaceae bacterium]
MRRERGQASVEFVALVSLCCLAFGALLALRGGFDGRDAGGFLAHHLVCAATGRCARDEQRLVAAYGGPTAASVRSLAPSLVFEPGEHELPVDWRECRRVACSVAPDDPALDAHVAAGRRGRAAARATAFTHVIRRGGRLYIQYWLYYPDSNTTLAGSDRIWARVLGWIAPYPGFHRDDWEGAFARVDPDGRVWLRASSHGHFQSCKWAFCRGEWARHGGWVRISRGSHSGHVPFVALPPSPAGPIVARPMPRPLRPRLRPVWPGRGLRERSTTGEGLRLVPLESIDPRTYVPLDPDVLRPWDKDAYLDPLAGRS